ncbi:MAG: hypothetical protein RBS07_17580 [Lentimicrobium sp.]|jgi:hypothetical protein|nr:hypothetical protein [Lentimicrobium sp.]
MRTHLAERFVRLTNALEEYLLLSVDLVKLTILEKLTRVTVMIVSIMVSVILGGLFILFASAAFVVWYGQQYGDYLTGLFIISGFIVFLNVLFYILKRQLITSSIIKALSRILFTKEED